jgi:allantoin racemase
MRNILIINPNTTAKVSALLQQHGQTIAGAGALVRVVTARFGAAYISCEASYAIAGHAARAARCGADRLLW